MEKPRKRNVSCCVKSCKNILRSTSREIKFYSFPAASYKAAQKKLWIDWVNKTKPSCGSFHLECVKSQTSMSEKTRGVMRVLLNSILSGFKPRPKPKLIGEDYFGTKFYEEPKEPGRKTQGRFFEPLDKENFEQELPAEWEAWLRYRRQEPPTKEEIEVNSRMILTKRENAANLKIEYAVNKEEKALEVKDSSQHSNTAFPTYEEYTTSPTKIWEPKK